MLTAVPAIVPIQLGTYRPAVGMALRRNLLLAGLPVGAELAPSSLGMVRDPLTPPLLLAAPLFLHGQRCAPTGARRFTCELSALSRCHLSTGAGTGCGAWLPELDAIVSRLLRP